MKKAILLSVVCALAVASSFGIVASAADYSKIDISDHVSGREFVGDDVIVTYDLPLRPYTDLYGFAAGSNVPELISSFNGNLYFTQDEIDGTFYYYDEFDYFEFWYPNRGYEQTQTVLDEAEFRDCDTAFVNGIPYDLVLEDVNTQEPIPFSVVGPFTLTGVFDNQGSIGWEWSGISLEDVSFARKHSGISYAEYQRINGKIFPLGRSNGRTNMIAVSDIKSGSGFELSFDLRYYIEHDSEEELNGNIAYYDAVWLDKNFNEISRSQEEIDWAPYPQYYEYQFDIDFTVPQDAAYFYLDFTTGYFYVNTAYEVSWVITNISMTTTLSSIEENSQTMQKVQQKLDKLDEQLGDIKDELTPTPEQNDKAEQLEQEIGNASDKLENNNSTLEDLTPTRPEINTDLTLDEEKLFAVSPLITNIWSLSGMQGHIGIVVLVATVAYIFFGKRDS